MKNNTKKGRFLKIAFWILAVLPLIVTLFVLPGAPATIPAHYGFNNMVNRWGSKYELLILPIFTIIFALIGWLYTRHYTSKENVSQKSKDWMFADRKALLIGMLFGIVLFNVLTYGILYTSCNKIQDLSGNGTNRIAALILNIFYIIMGNIMPKLKQNSFAGIRVSWTLENEDVWFRTHRFGGKLWVIGGIVLTVVCLLVPDAFALPISIGGLLAMTVVPCVYAHNEYVRITGDESK